MIIAVSQSLNTGTQLYAYDASKRERQILLAGGVLNYQREKWG